MKIRLFEGLKRAAPFLFLAFLCVRFFYPVFLENGTFYGFDNLFYYLPWSATGSHPQAHNPLITDPINIYYPHYLFVRGFFDPQDLSFRFWDASNFCGKPNPPFGGNPIEFFAYWLFSPSAAHDFILFIHLLATGLFMYLYLREIRLRRLPALVGAVAWMFNGHLMVWFEFQNLVLGAPALPAMLLFVERWLKTRRKLHAFLLIGALSFTIASGYAPLVFFHFLFLAAYALYRWFIAARGEPARKRLTRKDLIPFAVGAVLLISIGATFLSSHMTFLEEPHRKEFTFGEIYERTGQLPEVYLATLLFPDFFGSPAGGGGCFTPGSQPYNNYNELCIYSGVFVLFLAFSCLHGLGRRRYVLFYCATTLIPLMMAMGSLLYYPLFRFLPGFNLSTPTRVLYLFCFSLTVAAALGADILLEAMKRRPWPVIATWTALLLMTLVTALLVQTESGIRWVRSFTVLDSAGPEVLEALRGHFQLSHSVVLKPLLLAGASFLVLLLVLVCKEKGLKQKSLFLGLLILAYDLTSFGLHYNSISARALEYPKTGAIRFLEQDRQPFRIMSLGEFLHNGFAPYRIQDIGGYSSFYPRRYAEYLHLSQHGDLAPFPENFNRWVHFKRVGSPLLDLINMKYALLPSSWEARLPSLELVYDREVRIYENKNVLPRAFIVPSFHFCSTRESCRRTLGAFTREEFLKSVILEVEPPAHFFSAEAEAEGGESEVIALRYGRDRVDIDVRCPRKGFLVLSDSYHKAWRANVDGLETPVFRANYIMMAVPLRGGSRRVELRFQQKALSLSSMVTAMGWMALAALIVLSVRELEKEGNDPGSTSSRRPADPGEKIEERSQQGSEELQAKDA